MAIKFSNLMKTINVPIHKSQVNSNTKIMRKITSRHIILKFLKNSDKVKILKADRGKKDTLFMKKQR